MTPSAPRRPSSSRAVTPRPRKLAGGRGPAGPQPPTDPPENDEHETPEEPPPPSEWPVEGPQDGDGDDDRLLNSPRVTRMLLLMAAAFALLLVVEAAWFVIREVTEDDEPARSHAAGAIDVPKDRPVQLPQLTVQAGVEAAAKAAEKIVNRTYQGYDKEVDAATELMTGDFAAEYRKTTDDVRDQFIARKTTVQARVVGQGVVRANDTELQALLFIDQFVIRKEGKDAKTSRTPYRALVTVVNTEDGWLVEDLQTE